MLITQLKNITYILSLDHVLLRMTERFSRHFGVVHQLFSLLPVFSGFRSVANRCDVSDASSLYESLIGINRLFHELRA